MTGEPVTTEHVPEGITPIPLITAEPTAVQMQDTGVGATFKQVRIWVLAAVAFVVVFVVGRGLLDRKNAWPVEEGSPSASSLRPSLSPDELFARISPAVVQVSVHDRNGRTIGTGSGFLVSSTGLVATNYHVIEKAHMAHLVLADKTTRPVLGVAAYDEGADLAIIKAGGQIGAQALELDGGDLPPVGTKVYAIGNPLGFANTLSDGLVSGHRELGRLAEIQTTAPISPGSSGGPLLVAGGRVVGVTTFLIKGGQNLNFAVPVSHVTRLLDHFQIEGRLTPLPLGRQVEALPYLKSGFDSLTAGNHDKAIRDFDEAIRLDPDNASAHVSRGVAWQTKGDNDKAIKDFDAAILLDPGNSSAFTNRGNAWARKREYGKAIADYTSAIEINPTGAGAYYNRGNAWMLRREYDKATEDYSEAIRLDPSSATFLNVRGLAWRSQGEFDKAIRDFSEAIRLDPKMTMAYYYRGSSWADKRRHSQAIEDYSQAIRLEPGKALFYARRSLAWSELKEFDKAKEDFDEAIRIDPSLGR